MSGFSHLNTTQSRESSAFPTPEQTGLDQT